MPTVGARIAESERHYTLTVPFGPVIGVEHEECPSATDQGAVSDAEVEAGARALTEPAPMCYGDVLHDHDWTPMEAARTVLEAAASVRGAV